MVTLTLSEVDEAVAQRLEARARAAGRSAEAEARAILEAALRPAPDGREFVRLLRGDGPFFTDEEVEFIDSLGKEPVRVPDFSE